MLPTFLVAYGVALLATPAAIRLARRTGFLDRPGGYKAHRRPTPYLGGLAVLLAFLAGSATYGAFGDGAVWAIFAGAILLWAVGTADDRRPGGPRMRVAAEVVAASLLWFGGLGWSIFPGALPDFLLTIAWVVGLVNAFNLMDNQDGACATVGAVAATAIAVLAAFEGPEVLSAMAVALAAGCIGFLHFNLVPKARIFLGDGGSMLVGFLAAALAMAVPRSAGLDSDTIVPAILLVGLPLLDMTMVIVSRTRRGIRLTQGGRDHLTHRLLPKLGSTWAVALALAAGQAALGLLAVEMVDWSRAAVLVTAAFCFLLGLVTIAVLESPAFHPDGAAAAVREVGAVRLAEAFAEGPGGSITRSVARTDGDRGG